MCRIVSSLLDLYIAEVKKVQIRFQFSFTRRCRNNSRKCLMILNYAILYATFVLTEQVLLRANIFVS
jgi:hypothetical protein